MRPARAWNVDAGDCRTPPTLNVRLKIPTGVSVTFDGSNDATSNAGPTLHQREPASAERTLDDLILYLRATAHITLVAEGGVVPEAWRGDALTGIRETLRVACGAGCAITTSSQGDRHPARIVVASPVEAGGPGRTRRTEAP